MISSVRQSKQYTNRTIGFNKGLLGVLNKTGKHTETTNQVNAWWDKLYERKW